MSWTKQELVEEAFSVLALAGFVFDLTPDELQMALRRLDSMLAMWYEKGIMLGYPLAASPADSSLDQDSGLPSAAIETVYMNLAVRIAPTFGKMVPPDVKSVAKAGYDVLLARSAYPREQQLRSTLPRGAGNKPWRYDEQYMPKPDTAPLGVSDSGELIFRGD